MKFWLADHYLCAVLTNITAWLTSLAVLLISLKLLAPRFDKSEERTRDSVFAFFSIMNFVASNVILTVYMFGNSSIKAYDSYKFNFVDLEQKDVVTPIVDVNTNEVSYQSITHLFSQWVKGNGNTCFKDEGLLSSFSDTSYSDLFFSLSGKEIRATSEFSDSLNVDECHQVDKSDVESAFSAMQAEYVFIIVNMIIIAAFLYHYIDFKKFFARFSRRVEENKPLSSFSPEVMNPASNKTYIVEEDDGDHYDV